MHLSSIDPFTQWSEEHIIRRIGGFFVTPTISQKSKFYRRAVSKFLYTMRSQCSMFYSLYWEYELKILHISAKLAYQSIYFTEKHARWRFTWLTILLRLQHFSCFSNFRTECCKNYWLYRKMLRTKVAQN